MFSRRFVMLVLACLVVVGTVAASSFAGAKLITAQSPCISGKKC